MGMFDWMYCELPLPDGSAPGVPGYEEAGPPPFQTKDLDRLLETYVVGLDCRLRKIMECVDGGVLRCDRIVEFDGDLTFRGDGGLYVATFKDGLCRGIEAAPEGLVLPLPVGEDEGGLPGPGELQTEGSDACTP